MSKHINETFEQSMEHDELYSLIGIELYSLNILKKNQYDDYMCSQEEINIKVWLEGYAWSRKFK